MKRRSFLMQSAGVTMGSAFVLPLSARIAMAQSGAFPDPSLVNAGSSSHASTVGNAYANVLAAQDYSNLITLYGNLKNNLLSGGGALVFDSAMAQVNSSQLNAGSLNKAQLLTNIRAFQPTFQQADLDWLLSVIPPTSNAIASGLQHLQQKGITSLFVEAGADLIRMRSDFFLNQTATASPGPLLSPFSSPEAIRLAHQNTASISPDFNIGEPISTGGGGSKYCSTASAIRDVAAVAFLVIGIASGLGALAGAAWGAFSVFGGVVH